MDENKIEDYEKVEDYELEKCCKLLKDNNWVDITKTEKLFVDDMVKLYKNDRMGLVISFELENDGEKQITFYNENGDFYHIYDYDYYHLVGYMVCKLFLPFNFNDRK